MRLERRNKKQTKSLVRLIVRPRRDKLCVSRYKMANATGSKVGARRNLVICYQQLAVYMRDQYTEPGIKLS